MLSRSLRRASRSSAARLAARLAPARLASGAASPGKVLLLYSGGLDTSCILQWLLEQGHDVVAFMANLGQDEDFETARKKALAIGASSVHVEDLRQEFAENYIFPALQANAIYEDTYLMGTSLARPCIAKAAIDAADREGCSHLSHGATGKGNDQVRFELSFYALRPDIKMVVPWRTPEFFNRFQGRDDLMEYYVAPPGFPVSKKVKPFSMDDNMMHISYESGVLEDPANSPPDHMWRMTTSPLKAPDEPERVTIGFERGVPVWVRPTGGSDGDKITGSVALFEHLNKVAGRHGVGRVDLVENRFIGLKSRGSYETPAATVLRTAHIDLEGLTMDREVRRVRDALSPRFTDAVYTGFWFAPEREYLQQCVQLSQRTVTGEVTVELFKGRAWAVSRSSPFSLYDQRLVSMDEEGGFDPTNSTGFINTASIRLRAQHKMRKRVEAAEAAEGKKQ